MSTLTGGGCRISLTGTETAAVGASSKALSTAGNYFISLATGTGSLQGNAVASISGTVTAGTPVTLTLNALASAGLADTLVLTAVKELLLQDTSSVVAAGNLQLGDSTGTLTNAWTAPWVTADGVNKLNSRGALAIIAPDTGYVVDNTHKVLILKSSSGAIPYQIDIIGTQ